MFGHNVEDCKISKKTTQVWREIEENKGKNAEDNAGSSGISEGGNEEIGICENVVIRGNEDNEGKANTNGEDNSSAMIFEADNIIDEINIIEDGNMCKSPISNEITIKNNFEVLQNEDNGVIDGDTDIETKGINIAEIQVSSIQTSSGYKKRD